ncbi:MAG: Spi family protease inhibitor [Bacteroidia bacterium]|nr:Spi family protease inhibitor [Bacteroidia bacterium]
MKKIALLTVSVTVSALLLAKPVSEKDAQLIATNYYKHYVSSAVTDYSVERVIENKYEGLTTYFVFTFKADGFVMVSADDAATPVLGYSLENDFAENNLPPNIEEWYNSYDEQIKYIVDNKLDNLLLGIRIVITMHFVLLMRLVLVVVVLQVVRLQQWHK